MDGEVERSKTHYKNMLCIGYSLLITRPRLHCIATRAKRLDGVGGGDYMHMI